MEATNIQPFIHIFHVCGKNYLYDANRNVILKIGSELYNDIRSTLHDGDSFSLTPEMAGLLHEGYMQPSAIEKIEHPMTSKIEKLLDNSLHMLTLQVTQNCNLRCRYCVYSGSYINRHHSNKHMTFDIAKMAIDYYLAHSSQTTKLRFGFYGGEPLLEKTLIKECVNYIERNTLGKSVEFNITTNATLINEEFMNFIVEHSFFLTISFDGAKEIQDKNRIYASSGKGTFDKVMETVIWIRKKYPEFMSRVRFNMVIDPADGYKLSNDFFMSDERVKDIFVTAGEKNDNNLTEEIYVHPDYNRNKSYEEFKAIASYFRGNADRVSPLAAVYLKSLKANIVDKLKFDSSISKTNHPSGPCVPGLQRLFVNAEGNFYPCERVNESSELMKIGDVWTGIDIDKAAYLLNVGKLTEKQCKSCWAFRFCNSCAAYAENGDTLSAKKRLLRCDSIRNAIERSFMSYCILKELKMDFEELEETDL